MTRLQTAAPIYAALVGPGLASHKFTNAERDHAIDPNKLRPFANRALAAADVLIEEDAAAKGKRRGGRRAKR